MLCATGYELYAEFFNMNIHFQKNIEEKFECQRCNECCRKPGYVYLKEGEAERIAEYLKLPIYDFTDQYCDVIDRRRLVLKKQPDEVCIFLDDNGCQVHAVKPEQCREFPYRWHTPASWNYCAGLRDMRDKIPAEEKKDQ